jgi:hypothetical protein
MKMDQTTRASKEKVVTGKRNTIVSLRASNTGAESAGVSLRGLPESLAAEAAVLGSMIIGPEYIGEVVEHLKTNAFYRIEHQMIFDALVALYEKIKTGAWMRCCSATNSRSENS